MCIFSYTVRWKKVNNLGNDLCMIAEIPCLAKFTTVSQRMTYKIYSMFQASMLPLLSFVIWYSVLSTSFTLWIYFITLPSSDPSSAWDIPIFVKPLMTFSCHIWYQTWTPHAQLFQNWPLLFSPGMNRWSILIIQLHKWHNVSRVCLHM